VLEKVTKGSVVANWNANHPDKEIKPGDKLVKVNGVADKMENISKELSRSCSIKCEFIAGQANSSSTSQGAVKKNTRFKSVDLS